MGSRPAIQSFNDTVKGFAIVIALLHQLDEILNGAEHPSGYSSKGSSAPFSIVIVPWYIMFIILFHSINIL